MKHVAWYNPKSYTLHHPNGQCGHISFQQIEQIKSWKSAEGRNARVVGHPCRVCVSVFNFTYPKVVVGDE